MASLRQSITPEEITKARYTALIDTVRAYKPGEDLAIIERAYRFSLEHHSGQTRASGEPYLVHPLEVAHVLAEMKLDLHAIAAGLLHDAVEDTSATIEEIRAQFGEHVAHIVEGVTKIDKIQLATASKEERQAENVRKMMLAMVDDIRVVLLKLADRLHNMRTLEHLRPEQQQQIARETLDIYAPMAHRLGMGKVRGELEDLSFRFLDPLAYKQLSESMEERRARGESFLEKTVEQIRLKLYENGVDPIRIDWRIKRLYSVYQKLQRQRIGVDQVYDLLAVRIITHSVKDCYSALGAIHSLWRPVPGRIKDFIAMPRPNLYQSLHTTVMTEAGMQFEVQIRTEEMHKLAEEGIAAHWKYKDGGPVSAKDEQRLAWLRQVVEWQRETTDPSEFLSTLKIDLYPEEVYTFTPKGKVVILPRDATPVDFAYSVHTEVGHACVGARVNGRLVPLRHKLHNGDIIEILTQTGHAPSRDWLTFTKSSRARNKIKHWLVEHQREQAIEIGRKLIDREARKYRVSIKDVSDEHYAKIAGEYGVSNAHDLLAAIGYGRIGARGVLAKLVPESAHEISPRPDSELEPAHGIPGVIRSIFQGEAGALKVVGHDDLLIYRAKCCNPIRGEDIVGFVTRGKGVAVHAKTGPNVTNLLYEPDRRINVEWAKAPSGGTKSLVPKLSYPVKLNVFT
ncbi:MAG: bifunctional (p)ppGpp synthetase/guanosine-3',5'-bis(diphosphate) 3'-pyrophosphohydrolase, partial [Acidobacteriales bacterium]|nr:bifunctional (p)ppGpp synthetase/guanosine-3',5'-bis(diphosphate) 3'-pyrophosphohydrolase [Terriglobales bacterium]